MLRIIIFANGTLNNPNLLRAKLRPADRIFCADGGTYNALALDLIPETIIGDLDSLAADTVADLESKGVTLQRHPARKNETDLELALRLAIAEKPDEIVLVTALGGRIDHMLANVLLLARPEYAPAQLTLLDGPYWARLLRSDQSLVVHGRAGDTLSLIPLTPLVSSVSLSGVEWPLERVVLSLGSTLTLSNTLTGPEATIHIGQGLVLVVHFAR